MATQKQIQANRSNAQLSTGPRTEQGKAISRMNALKTGIDARNEAASGEDPAALAALAAEYGHEFQPIGLVERLLVDILIKDDWFLRRYRFLAADLVNHGAAVAYETKRGADFGAGFAANTESFHRLHRHIIDTERSFFTHLAELERRQALRRQHQEEVVPPTTLPPKTNPLNWVPPPPPPPPPTPPPQTPPPAPAPPPHRQPTPTPPHPPNTGRGWGWSAPPPPPPKTQPLPNPNQSSCENSRNRIL